MRRISRSLIGVGSLLVLGILAIDAVLVYSSLGTLIRSNAQVDRSRVVLNELERTLSILKDAETGQRGYLLTGREDYLTPYRVAESEMGRALDRLRSLTADSADQRGRVNELSQLAAEKMAELRQTVALRRDRDLEAALRVVQNDRGRSLMGRASGVGDEIRAEEERLLAVRSRRSRAAVGSAVVTFTLTTATALLLLAGVASLQRRDERARERAAAAIRESEAWLWTTLASIGDAVIATDERGRVRFLNPVAEALTGWVAAEAEGRPMAEVFRIINETTRRPAENPVERVLREGVVVGLANHTVLISRTGAETPIEDSAAPIRDARGAVAGVVMVFRDVTVGRAAETLLRASEERKSAILRTALDAIITIDERGRILEWNPAAGRIFGHEEAAVLGLEMCEVIIPPPLREAHRRGMAHYLDTGEGPILGQRVEITALRGDGAEFPVELAVTRITSESRLLFTAQVRDITERKQAEEALREGERQFRTLADSIPQLAWIAGPDGSISWYNRRWFDYTGTTLEEMKGSGWRSVQDPDELPRVVEKFRAAIAAGEPWEDTFPLRRHDGAMRWHLSRALPVRDDRGRIVRWFGTNTDVHDRRRADAERERLIDQLEAERRHLQTLIESSRDCIKELDLGGRLVAISQTGQRLLEIRDLCDVLDKPWVEFWKGADREAAERAIALALAGGVGSFEGYSPTAAGMPKWWDVIVTPILDSEGKPHRLLSVSRDITERRRHEAERERLLAEAQEANQAKTHFLAVLSHELRTPLNPILLAVTSILERPIDSDEVRPNLEMIRENVLLQSRLIDDLLDVMRIVRGKMPLQWEVADGHGLIRRAVQICRSEVLGKGLRLDLDLEARDHYINADPARFQQVIWNLVKNAVKFTPAGGSIAVRTRNPMAENEVEAGASLVIEVADTGIGIEPEILPLIFDPFQQGETQITRKFGGLGLGLAISRGIVEAHDGVLAAESEGKGLGTTFRLVLRALPEPTTDAVRHDPAGSAIEGPTPPRPLKILLVEDEPATNKLMARLLRGLGHEVTTAATIAEGIESEATSDIGLIVSDIGLPDGSGLELMRRVIARRGPVPAIALTGYGMEEDVLRSREAGFTAHMTKPIDFTKLEALIRRVAP